MNPTISIITVCFNSYGTIEDTIMSVINQSYDNIEYIIIDGGSTDGTVDIIKKYSDKIAYWVSEPDNGIYDAMNKGTRLATGDYIYYLGADDTLIHDVIQNVAAQIKNKDEVYYGDVIFQPEGKLYGGEISLSQIVSKNISHQAIFYPKIVKLYPYDLKYKCYADWYHNMILISRGMVFNYIAIKICNFQRGGQSEFGDPKFKQDRYRIVMKLFGIQGIANILLNRIFPRRIRS